MPCGVCHNVERGAEEKREYLCSRCLHNLMSMDRDQKRAFIDSLYLKGQDEEAEFLESFFEGSVTKAQEPKEKPKLLLRRRE